MPSELKTNACEPISGRRKMRLFFVFVFVVSAILFFAVRHTVRSTNRDAWAFSVINVVGAAVLEYTNQFGRAPESVSDLIDSGMLIADESEQSVTLRTPYPYDAGPVNISSVHWIRLRFPGSVTEWKIVDDKVLRPDGQEANLPSIEIEGIEYHSTSLALRANRSFARKWIQIRQGKPTE